MAERYSHSRIPRETLARQTELARLGIRKLRAVSEIKKSPGQDNPGRLPESAESPDVSEPVNNVPQRRFSRNHDIGARVLAGTDLLKGMEPVEPSASEQTPG